MWWQIALVVFILIGGGMVAMLVKTLPIAKRVYRQQLVRTEPEKWGRVCSAPENQEQLAMWNEGCHWAEQHKEQMQEVHLVHDGLNLYGEYYALSSSKRCVLILPGRCECLKYSYYFAPPYEQAGLNVLVIDTRAHGKSDGTLNTVGAKESGDVLAWMDLLQKQFAIEEIYLHTICIGTASGLLAMTHKDCPAAVKGIVSEGCFVSFRETFKQHMIADRRPLFPVLDLVMREIRKNTGTHVGKTAPLRVIKNLHQRALFLYGKQDRFSLPAKSQQLFDACQSKDKTLVWFEQGGHSHLRINNPQQYDHAILEFLK